MIRNCCLAGVDDAASLMLRSVLRGAGVASFATLAQLDIAELGRLAPDLLICDIDGIDLDPLELVRQLRFVLPDTIVAVYTEMLDATWGRACHVAGANCLLLKASDQRLLTHGLIVALESGCYTDPRFATSRMVWPV